MAKYAISQEGIDALQTLSSRLVESTSSIDDASKVLYSTIEGVSDGLGVYEKDIYILLRDVINTNQKGKESVDQLTRISIPRQILEIEKLLILCGGDSSDEDPDEPPQKKLVLRRHR